MKLKNIYFITLFLFINSILSCTITSCDSSKSNCQINCGNKNYKVNVILDDPRSNTTSVITSGFHQD